jgi:hypothetical protein
MGSIMKMAGRDARWYARIAAAPWGVVSYAWRQD